MIMFYLQEGYSRQEGAKKSGGGIGRRYPPTHIGRLRLLCVQIVARTIAKVTETKVVV